ncbi:ribonuclease HII [Candidatus Saccharibacteria bacterium]|jgi:ribonuclease HII|nr:ribonuclease HII [Candidatus Saccharibacteria bacterium]
MILGIDEAGRGPWAGPLVVGAVVLGGIEIDGLTDSKKLTKKRREALEPLIRERARGFGVGWVSAAELDGIGMSAALKLATIRAASKIKCSYDEIIIDGTVNFLSETGKGRYVKTMPKADLLIPSVSAASVLAKVARDRYMTDLSSKYPEYGFASNSGYGVAKHREAIDKFGVMSEHRLSFAPLQKYKTLKSASLDSRLLQENPKKVTTTKSTGDIAEGKVALFLESEGHTIIERNWRTRFCEIDIVSKKGDTVYFTEVKYRKQANCGNGLEAITPVKLRQMRFAADLFVLKHPVFANFNQRLCAAGVSGPDFLIDDLIELV